MYAGRRSSLLGRECSCHCHLTITGACVSWCSSQRAREQPERVSDGVAPEESGREEKSERLSRTSPAALVTPPGPAADAVVAVSSLCCRRPPPHAPVARHDSGTSVCTLTLVLVLAATLPSPQPHPCKQTTGRHGTHAHKRASESDRRRGKSPMTLSFFSLR